MTSKESKNKEKFNEARKDALEDLERYIEELSNFLPLAICSLSPLLVIVDINKAFTELTGFEPIEIIGKHLELLFLNKKEIQKIFQEVEKGGVVRQKELTLVSKDKKRIPVSLSISQRKDREENFIGYFLAITDISKIKEFQSTLEEKVKEKTKELRERINQLEKFHGLTVGRELKMAELKKEIKKLKNELEIERARGREK